MRKIWSSRVYFVVIWATVIQYRDRITTTTSTMYGTETFWLSEIKYYQTQEMSACSNWVEGTRATASTVFRFTSPPCHIRYIRYCFPYDNTCHRNKFWVMQWWCGYLCLVQYVPGSVILLDECDWAHRPIQATPTCIVANPQASQ